MYLFSLRKEQAGTESFEQGWSVVSGIETAHKVSIKEIKNSFNAMDTTAHIVFYWDKTKDTYFAYLSEFPGNCSTLILHGLESRLSYAKDVYDAFLLFSEELCVKFEYGALILTGTEKEAKEYLLSKGYILITETYNPHSGNLNYFVKKAFA